jgi:hypothetical protein
VTTYYHNILDKLADAVEGVINAFDGSALTGVTVFKGASMTALTAPRIEILCEAEAEQIGATITGNYNATVRVRVIANQADSTRPALSGYVAAVGDALFRDDFPAQVENLSPAITNFTMDEWWPRRVAESIDGGEFIVEFECAAHCWPS